MENPSNVHNTRVLVVSPGSEGAGPSSSFVQVSHFGCAHGAKHSKEVTPLLDEDMPNGG